MEPVPPTSWFGLVWIGIGLDFRPADFPFDRSVMLKSVLKNFKT
jgi:hypothetical protein